ncbi:hypothetical protein TcCL_NonESM10663 [Trypanosoma cruzi]|nr:hypothetical protein TcCL_NonESM10663 [Trypanosoma cruzi]
MAHNFRKSALASGPSNATSTSNKASATASPASLSAWGQLNCTVLPSTRIVAGSCEDGVVVWWEQKRLSPPLKEHHIECCAVCLLHAQKKRVKDRNKEKKRETERETTLNNLLGRWPDSEIIQKGQEKKSGKWRGNEFAAMFSPKYMHIPSITAADCCAQLELETLIPAKWQAFGAPPATKKRRKVRITKWVGREAKIKNKNNNNNSV